MKKLKFSELDPKQKRAASWLADEAGTLTPTILAATAHVGELWEVKAFLKHFPRDSVQHEQLAERLRLGGASSESILDCIRHVAPAYETLGNRFTLELTDLLPELENGIASL